MIFLIFVIDITYIVLSMLFIESKSALIRFDMSHFTYVYPLNQTHRFT